MTINSTADAIRDSLISPNVADSNMEAANVVDALDSIAKALRRGLRELGNNEAATEMGAIEAHGNSNLEGLTDVANAIRELADAVRSTSYAALKAT